MISLFYFIICITFINANVSKIISFFVKLFRLGSLKECTLKRDNIRIMLAELSLINMTDEWAKYAKLQRKINKEKDELSKTDSEQCAKLDKILSSVGWILRLSLGLTLTLTVLYNRGSVVVQIPEGWLWPFQSIICWSREIPGGVTAPCWVIISSSVARSLSRFI